ncbi:uncharacterized protein LOC132043512 [Lycium ferocissimum]|uniref:uncharacterized protein LOC132043512 n=1 Tax=Lycium ferocissimum TaxID=112874 RepID=UPI0028167670|nr:uncharacterized protein LOC132043512 [Lycium ferocissimum]
MEKNSSVGAKPWSHHHHHFQILHNCPLHSYMLQCNNHVPTCPLFSPSPVPQNPEQHITPVLLPDDLNIHISEPNDNFTDSRMKQDEDLDLEDEEEEPIFVLTDEWRDFFAKSEAKRRKAKKHAKKKGKSKVKDENAPALESDCDVKNESAICPEV